MPEGYVTIDGNTANIYPNGYYEVSASDGDHELTVYSKNGETIHSEVITVDGDTRYDNTFDRVRGSWRRPPTDLSTMKDNIDTYYDYGVTDLHVETLFHGKTIYPSSHTLMKDGYADTYLQEVIDYAHQKGMRVHAWCETMYLWNCKYLGQPESGHPMAGNDEFCSSHGCYNLNGDYVTTDKDGRWEFEDGKNFASPFNDNVVGLISDIAAEIDSTYDVDGVQFDYVRFPKADPAAGYGQSSPYDGTQTDDEMQSLREDAVDNLVSSAASNVGTWTAASAAVFAAYYTSSDEAELHKSQDWETWGNDYDIDWTISMCYAYDSSEYDHQMSESIKRQSWGETVMPALAINDGHDDINIQYRYYDDYNFGGYHVWKAEDINKDLP